MLAMVAIGTLDTLVSILIRQVFATILPFEPLFVMNIGLFLGNVLFAMIKFIPVKDERTGQVKRWALGTNHISQISLLARQEHTFHTHTFNTGTWLHMPASHRFDPKARAAFKRAFLTTYVFSRIFLHQSLTTSQIS